MTYWYSGNIQTTKKSNQETADLSPTCYVEAIQNSPYSQVVGEFAFSWMNQADHERDLNSIQYYCDKAAEMEGRDKPEIGMETGFSQMAKTDSRKGTYKWPNQDGHR